MAIWEVVVCTSRKAALGAATSENLSTDCVLTTRLCCISGETY